MAYQFMRFITRQNHMNASVSKCLLLTLKLTKDLRSLLLWFGHRVTSQFCSPNPVCSRTFWGHHWQLLGWNHSKWYNQTLVLRQNSMKGWEQEAYPTSWNWLIFTKQFKMCSFWVVISFQSYIPIYISYITYTLYILDVSAKSVNQNFYLHLRRKSKLQDNNCSAAFMENK